MCRFFCVENTLVFFFSPKKKARRTRLLQSDGGSNLNPYLPSTKRFLRALGVKEPAAVLANKRLVACRKALIDVGHNNNGSGSGNMLRCLQKAMDELSEGRAELASHKDAQVLGTRVYFLLERRGENSLEKKRGGVKRNKQKKGRQHGERPVSGFHGASP